MYLKEWGRLVQFEYTKTKKSRETTFMASPFSTVRALFRHTAFPYVTLKIKTMCSRHFTSFLTQCLFHFL